MQQMAELALLDLFKSKHADNNSFNKKVDEDKNLRLAWL